MLHPLCYIGISSEPEPLENEAKLIRTSNKLAAAAAGNIQNKVRKIQEATTTNDKDTSCSK